MKPLCALATLTLTLALSISHASEGSEGGNGGGGICLERRCLTMAEAGLRISEESESWTPSAAALAELRAITGRLPFQGESWFRGAAGVLGTFKRVDAVDRRLFARVVGEYQETMRRARFTPRGQLEIFAVTDVEGKTYILPAFEELAPRQQALVLLHENAIRVYGQRFIVAEVCEDGGCAPRSGKAAVLRPRDVLTRALVLDGGILDYLAGKSTGEYDHAGFLRVLDLSGQGVDTRFRHMVATSARPLTLGDFVAREGVLGNAGSGTFQMPEGEHFLRVGGAWGYSFEELIATRALREITGNPHLFDDFSGMEIAVAFRPISRVDRRGRQTYPVERAVAWRPVASGSSVCSEAHARSGNDRYAFWETGSGLWLVDCAAAVTQAAPARIVRPQRGGQENYD